MTEENRSKKLLMKGSELIGSAIGGVLGFFGAGPWGAAGGAAAGTMCGQVLAEMTDRMLSQREQVRIGAAAAIALLDLKARLERGEKLRDDDFFEAKNDDRQSNAEQLFEGVLIKARDEHEEKKVIILGKLYSNIAFDNFCTPQEGNFLINSTNVLTYTQLCLLNIFHNKNMHNLRSQDLKAGENVTYASLSCLQQTFDLFQRGYLLLRKPNEEHNTVVLELNQITPSNVFLSITGTRLFQMLSLDQLDFEDLKETATYLQRLM